MLSPPIPRRRSSKQLSLKIFATSALLLVIYNECLIYYLSYLSWPQPHEPDTLTLSKNDSNRPLRLLLVADPQLIGENDEPWYFSHLARWDSDRYLRATFTLANSHSRPDATLYLGDLFDEGLKSTDPQYDRYFTRFKSIFKYDQMERTFGTKQIFIAGDNDIGGEYFGDRNDELGERFERYFGPLVDVLKLTPSIEIIKLDLDYTVSFYNQVKRRYLLSLLDEKPDNEKYTIILNHMSLIRKNPQELNALNEDTNAGLIIKGDSHKFEIIKYSYSSNRVVEYINFKKDPSNHYVLDLEPNKRNGRVRTVYEVSIPTCSYRMGVPNMGYGMMTITRSGKAYLSILWLPSRYQSIYYYLVFLLVFSTYFLFKFAFKRVFRVFFRTIILKFF